MRTLARLVSLVPLLLLAGEASAAATDPARAAGVQDTLLENEALFALRPEKSEAERLEIQAMLTSAMSSAHGLHEQSGELRASGPDYRARFPVGGFEFVPALPSAAQTQRVSMELVSVTRGGQLLHAATSVEPSSQGKRVEYDHGAFIERYEVRAEGIEQSFEFPEPLGGHGDLVVRLRLDSSLHGAATIESREGLRLSMASGTAAGGVRIGEVTGISADGATVEGTLSYDGTYLDLALPAAFVDGASYPLVLDPLVGTELAIASFSDARDGDVAYDVTNDKYLMVRRERFSEVDSQLSYYMVDSSGQISKSASLGGIGELQSPAVANVNESDAFVIVYEDLNIETGTSSIWLAHVAGDGTFLGFSSIPSSGDQRNPDIAGDPVLGFSGALVVWQAVGSGIAGIRLDVPRAGEGDVTKVGSVFEVSSDPSDGWPAISKGLGAAGSAMVVWERSADDSQDIYARPYRYTGTPIAEEFAVALTPASDEFQPDVDGDGEQFLVVYESSNGELRDIKCVSAALQPEGVVEVSQEKVLAGDAYNILASVGFAGHAYLVAWSNLSLEAIQATTILPDCSTCESTLDVSVTPGFGKFNTEIATVFSSSLEDDQAMLMWEAHNNGAAGNPSSIQAHVFQAMAAGPSLEISRNSAKMEPNTEALRPGVTTRPILGVLWDPVIDHAEFMPEASVDVLIVSTAPSDVSVENWGALLCDVLAPTKCFFSSPGSPFQVPIPSDCSLIGATLCSQGLSGDDDGNRLTNALDFTIGTE